MYFPSIAPIQCGNFSPNPFSISNQSLESSRRRGNLEVEEAGRQMKRAFNTLESVLNKKHEEDEYDLYGRILANKLRKLPENERQLFMYNIDGMFVQRYHRFNNPLLSSLQPTFSRALSTGMNTANESSSTVTSYSDSPCQPLSILIPEQPLTTYSTY